MNFIITLLIMLVVLGVIIFIHEFGHFIAAKKSGVYVDEFSIGMGPKIWTSKPKKGETKYSLRLLPLGGFVAMANTEDDGHKIRKDQILENKSFIKRLLVLSMGIIFNFILTILLLFLNGLIYGSPNTKAVIGSVVENSAVENAGMKAGDIITSVDGIKTNTWDDVLLEISIKKQKDSYNFVVERQNQILNFNISPTVTQKGEETDRFFGFSMQSTKNYGVGSAINYSLVEFRNISKSLFRILGYLFTGKVSTNNLSGPVGVFSVVDQVKETGFENIIYLIAYLSINVGIINLIPIPIFDGGRILLLVIEKVIGKKIPQKVEGILNTIGLILLVVLMIYVTFNDIFKLI